MSVTSLVSHFEMLLLKRDASLKAHFMVVTLLVLHLERSPLNTVAF